MGKLGILSKGNKFNFNISLDASESDDDEQDDCNEDEDFDALLISHQSSLTNNLRGLNALFQAHFRPNHYSIPDSPPPDFI